MSINWMSVVATAAAAAGCCLGCVFIIDYGGYIASGRSKYFFPLQSRWRDYKASDPLEVALNHQVATNTTTVHQLIVCPVFGQYIGD